MTMLFDPGALDSLSEDAISDILHDWAHFCSLTTSLLSHSQDGPHSHLEPTVASLCNRGLAFLLQDHFLLSLEEAFKRSAVKKFWQQFDSYFDASAIEKAKFHVQESWPEEILSKSLEQLCSEKRSQENCLLLLIETLKSYEQSSKGERDTDHPQLMSRYQLMVSSVLLTTLPWDFPDVLRIYFKKKLEELNSMMADGDNDELEINTDNFPNDADYSHMDTSMYECNGLVMQIGKVVSDLRSLGFTSMAEDAYSSAIFLLLKSKVNKLAGDDYRVPVLWSLKKWIRAVPLQFLHDLLGYLGDSIEGEKDSPSVKSPLASQPSSVPGIGIPSEALVRWQLRLEYFAYETLQDLRIGKLFEIIVDYPDSSPAIEDLKRCLEYTGQHSKLVDSFISSLKYRLLTAGASTNDILHQYVSTIKALRTIDPAGVFLEAVGEPIRDYLRGRKDTIKCIVTMLTDGTGGNSGSSGNAGDSLLEELNRDAENQDGAEFEEDGGTDEKQAWLNAERWEPDPVEADPLKGSRNRRKIDILELMVGIIGSKDQLVNEYRVMLAEKLLNKSDYDIDSEIRTLELLKIHFGESSMQKCEIMLNDLIDSKRTNANIKATLGKSVATGPEQGEIDVSLDILDATIISSNFWPPIQEEELNIPSSVDRLLSDYGKRFHEIKAPRKLMWKKNLGTVKLELQFEDRSMQFTVSPVHAAIIMQFQEKPSWNSKSLAAEIGMPADALNRRIAFWISKGVLTESAGTGPDDPIFTIVDSMSDFNKNGLASEGCQLMEEESERSVASVEEQLIKEMTVFEKFILGLLTNYGTATLDKIHNTLKMFCTSEPTYDKSLHQLQSFLSDLISEEKLEMRDGLYSLKK
ncbi:hypothetical protein LUZ63_005112 [Rhynchospora breviuscula]|uniref:Anaphase-promoting complex subunit 2 n=1 Tax=Rhynchospora breviuscula TaxID=2022672 RepID=A0A9Q0HSR0_9POAL|nr:hypothetical protein LUZ63_005112 [Rhynchospora breviuscula]